MGGLVNKLTGKHYDKEEQNQQQKQGQKGIVIDDHLVPIEQLLSSCETNIERGLSEEEAQQRLKKYGLNRLTPPAETSEIIKFLRQLFGGFSLLLWAGAILCIGAYFVEKGKNPDNVRIFFKLFKQNYSCLFFV